MARRVGVDVAPPTTKGRITDEEERMRLVISHFAINAEEGKWIDRWND